MSFDLLDSVYWNSVNPDTFPIPDEGLRTNLPLGSYAQLQFQFPGDAAERMWVMVEERIATEGGVIYKGMLASRPVHEGKPVLGDEVVFGEDHVISWKPGK
jgi:hypothetical protein